MEIGHDKICDLLFFFFFLVFFAKKKDLSPTIRQLLTVFYYFISKQDVFDELFAILLGYLQINFYIDSFELYRYFNAGKTLNHIVIYYCFFFHSILAKFKYKDFT